ncbi:3-deoxy-manno-octulosonate cytidylyltransferase [Methylocella sp.]|uniref:3-deoxy-manno-octulosonate cytidylyltransferase n=1 Tax=Methylocella sp. TaxID=1978226 RepID=UPI0035AE51F8
MAAIVIPARWGSRRFPGKPLAMIAGRTLIERVLRVAGAVRNCARVLVATDDERIAAHVRALGGEAAMTSPDHRNGAERVREAAAVAGLDDDALVNLQGDALLTPPWVIEALIDELERGDAPIVTPAVRLEGAALAAFAAHKAQVPTSGTCVVFDRNRDALYFSKAPIPFMRAPGAAHRHIGLYGFRREALEAYCALAPTPLETAEGLEQLRALEHGMKIRVVVVDYRGRAHGSIDDPADVPVVEAIIAREGELAPD